MYKGNKKHIDDEVMDYVSSHLDADIDALIGGKGIKMGNRPVPAFDESMLYDKVCSSMKQPAKRSAFTLLLKWAAVFLLLFNVGYFTYQYIERPVAKMCEVSVPKGDKMMVMLADGTRVWLNADSKLVYPDFFDSDDRRVALVGEAYFEVKSDSHNPFVVTAGGTRIKVTGTCFNVTAYPSDGCVVTTLDEGRIAIGPNADRAPTYAMIPGQTAVFDKNQGVFRISMNDNYKEASDWRSDRLVFRNARLEQVLNVLSRKFDVSFTIANDKIRSYTYNLSCRGNELSSVLEMIQQITPVKVEKNQNIYM